MSAQQIVVTAVVDAPQDVAWTVFTSPEHITQWNFASPDWCCPSADVDLRTGGTYTARMEARDGSMGFDFAGTYDEVEAPRVAALRLEDGRVARTEFSESDGKTTVQTTFDAEDVNPVEMQRAGWQAILDNYKAHAERVAG